MRIDPRGTPCLTGFGSDVIFLVSQTVVALPDTIKPRPRYLGWHRTLIMYSLHIRLDYDRLRQKLYGNRFHRYYSPVTSLLSILNNIFVGDSDKCRFSGMTRTQG